MAFEQYFLQEWKSFPAASGDSEKNSPCFDCNICLDFAREPVVTFCGHLYCWPCIYEWFHLKSSSVDPDDLPQCPVCKTELSEKTLIPLYGRGESLTKTEYNGKIIPPRPPACGMQGLAYLSNASSRLAAPHGPYHNPQTTPHPYASFTETMSPPNLDLRNSSTASPQPVVGMFGEMVYARVFGNSEGLYAYPNSYHLVGNSSPRLRRLQLEADKSLNRVSIFLFCCFLLCLLLF